MYVHVRERETVSAIWHTRNKDWTDEVLCVLLWERESILRHTQNKDVSMIWFTVIERERERERDNTRWDPQNMVWCDEALYVFLWERESAFWHLQNKHRKMKHCNLTLRDSEKACPSNVEVNEHRVILPSYYFRNVRLMAYVGWGERTVIIHWCST